MTDDKKQFPVRLNHTTYRKMKFIAAKEKRSLNAKFEMLAEVEVEKFEKEYGNIEESDL